MKNVGNWNMQKMFKKKQEIRKCKKPQKIGNQKNLEI